MRKFDLFPKVSDETLDKKTRKGAIVSLITFCFMLLIIFLEISHFQKQKEIKQHAMIKNQLIYEGKPIDIFMDVTVSYPCQLLNLMVQDITGNHQLTATQSISRQRLDSSHRPIDPTEIFDNDQKSIFSKCGSCYGSNYSECCLTCFDVVSAFKLQNKLVPNLRNVDQCVRDKKAISDGESCRIKAKVRTSFSSGRITLRAGGNTKMPIHYKNDFSYLGESANLSHWIHELRFGEGVKEFINPLDNSQYLQYGPGFYHFKYTATIVPSVYTLDNGEKIETNQYSVTFSPKQITKTISKQHPSIDFVFETSPISVETVKTTKGYLQLITGICAIIGGGFTLGGLLDRLLYRIDRMKPHK